MTSNNQVSPVIRISRGERDASARATHLKAASRKYLETTIERKQMSTTTNFKRIALVAVAALGLGVLSSVPSQAAVSGLTVTVVNGTSTAAKSDSTTAATFTISGFVGPNDSVVAYVVFKSKPAASGSVAPVFYNLDSSTPTLTSSTYKVDSTTSTPTVAMTAFKVATDSVTALTNAPGGVRIASTADANINHKFGFQLDSSSATRAAGTYTYSLVVKTYEAGTSAAGAATTTSTRDISITVAELANESTVASPATSTALLYGAGTWATTATDSTVAVTATAAASTARASVKVDLLNAAGGQATVLDSITVTIDKGNASIGTGNNSGATATAVGKSLVPFSYTGSTVYVTVFSDGSTGPATLTIATKNAGTFTKKVTFYGDGTAATATALTSVIGATGTSAILGVETDALKNNLGGGSDLYAYSSDTTVVSNYGTACGTYNATVGGVLCNLTGLKSGTASITLRDAATVAASTFVSNAAPIRVSINEVATSATITFNKSTYAPGEKVTAIVKVLDAKGQSMPAGTYANTFASGGITTSSQLTWAAGESLTATSVTTASNTTASASAPVVSLDPVAQFTYFLPASGGNIVFSTTGGTGLAAAGQVAITATATVTDSGAAALAAVTALATTVASLRTLIVTLTNLVLKIQKKVKA